jgi:hypothetical protein
LVGSEEIFLDPSGSEEFPIRKQFWERERRWVFQRRFWRRRSDGPNEKVSICSNLGLKGFLEARCLSSWYYRPKHMTHAGAQIQRGEKALDSLPILLRTDNCQ